MENIIKKRRLELGLTQAALAKMIGITQQHLDRYEKGYQIPVEKIPHVAKVLNIDMWLLLPEDFKKPEEVLTDEEKEFIRLFRKSKANNGNADTTAKAE